MLKQSVGFQHSQRTPVFSLDCYCFIISGKVRTERMCLVVFRLWIVLDHQFREIFPVIYVMFQNFLYSVVKGLLFSAWFPLLLFFSP